MGSDLGTVATVDTARPEPRWVKHMRHVSLETLFEDGEFVESLVEHPGWNPLMRLLEAEVAEIDRKLDGRDEPLSQAEYAMAHGRRSGLRAAADAATALIHTYRVRLQEQRAKHENGIGVP